jgi:hypothetical protein
LRDTRLIALAGVLPDADGLGIAVDLFKSPSLDNAFYYQEYHHFLAHGIAGGLVIAGVLAFFAQRRLRVFLWSLLVFHLHLVCDLAGSRGPDARDIWPIYYLGPFSRVPMWSWPWQWPLDGWQNRIISVALFAWALGLAVKRGDSFAGVFNRRLDRVFTGALQKWAARWR